jgi:uncharacterized phage protein (TIGR01671 family)
MRDIKFRVWEKKKKRWAQVYLFNIDVPAPGRIFIVKSNDDYEVSEFTGLLDKNGVEIYEGDIVKFNNHTFEISFIGSAFIIHTLDLSISYTLFELIKEKPKFLEELEVIGNLYETPELLEKKE